MRWKLLRRRWSVSAPRVSVRRTLPWPLRWAVVALVLGFSAAIGLWAFEFGKDIAGLDRDASNELARLRAEMVELKADRDKAQTFAHTADSLLKAEHAAQEKLAQQVRQLESENMALKADLGFFERLLPASSEEGLSLRGLRADALGPGRLRYQLLVTQSGKAVATWAPADGARPLQLQRYARLDGLLEPPAAAVVKSLQAKLIDDTGAVRATQTAKL
ncbi:MAG: hypothetical protein HY021_04695 [Burkholderiales bacterium]|nr:hypothetical protein [Burkholderiales bacterium]